MGFRQIAQLAMAQHKAFSLLGYGGWLAIIVLSVLPADERPHTGYGGFYEHFVAYAMVAGCLALAYQGRKLIYLFVALVAGSGLLELAQQFIPGRTCELEGVTSALAGVITAALAVNLLRRFFPQ